jgi:hypothetical protein
MNIYTLFGWGIHVDISKNFVQNHIFGLYGETRYFKQLNLIQIVSKHSKTIFSCLSSHVV